MKSNQAIRLLALLLCSIMVFSLFACVNGNEDTTTGAEAPPNVSGETTGGQKGDDETIDDESSDNETIDNETNGTDETKSPEESTAQEDENVIELGNYSNGGRILDAGDELKKNDFALSKNEIDASAAVSKTAEEMLALLSNKDGVKAGEVYKVSGRLILSSDTTYYGNGAALILEDGIEIASCSGIALTELIIDGSVLIDKSTDITLEKLDIKGNGEAAVTIRSECTDIAIKNCILSSNDTALVSQGKDVSVYKSKLVADKGIVATGEGFIIQGSRVEAGSLGVSLAGECAIVRNNTITVGKDGIGVEMKNGYNGLVALNEILDVQKSVILNDGFNCVIVLNRAIYIGAENNTNLYVIKNRLGGAMEFKNNKYFIADENVFVQDKLDHPVVSLNNTEINGDNITNVDERLEFGANEELLPHTNKEQFVGMERLTTVTDLSTKKSYADYIRHSAQRNSVVVVPPGVYTVDAKLELGSSHGGTDIYAYGVYAEATFVGMAFQMTGCTDVNILGLTVGYSFPSSAQIQIIEKLGDNKVKVITSAGFDEGFGKSDLTKYHRNLNDMYHQNDTHPHMNVGDNYTIEANSDGTYTFTYKYASQYNMAMVGDIYTNRLTTRGGNAVRVDYGENVKFKDFTVIACSCLASVRCTHSRGVLLERYHTDAPASYIIDKETYDSYKAIEEKYNVDTEVFIDEAGRYRGTRPRIGGTGALEIMDSYEGVSLTSCKIENICDDGSNQRGTTSRVAGIEDNGDGTYTVYFKGCHTAVYHTERCAANQTNSFWTVNQCASVQKNDVLLAYASNGALLFENAVALEDAKPHKGDTAGHWAHTDKEGNRYCDICKVYIGTKGLSYPEFNSKYDASTGKITFNMSHNNNKNTLTFSTTLYAVKIKADSVNMAALEGYDLASNDYHSSTQVFFHNVSKNCAGFTFDNTLIQNHRSRGLLIKAPNITVKNCTFRDLQRHALVFGSENAWGESSVPSNINIMNCVFDNVCDFPGGYDKADHVAIIINGLGETNNNITLSDNFACNNINITHNKFINNKGKHLICASGVADLNITENVFEERAGDGKIIYINGCVNITMQDNTYSEALISFVEENKFGRLITGYNFKNFTFEGNKVADNDSKPQ